MTVSDDELIARLTGENPDRVTPVDRLRLYGVDPETFPLDSDDAWAAVDLCEEAAARLRSLSESKREMVEALKRHRSDREYIIGWNDGFEFSVKEDLKFPTMLRKMWSGDEVQKWLDKEFAARAVIAKEAGHAE